MILGCATHGNNFARIVSQRAAFPDNVLAITVNRFCSSGLQVVAMAANAIMANQADLLIVGGAESMSLVPMISEGPADMISMCICGGMGAAGIIERLA